MADQLLFGLTEQEVSTRRAAGQGNNVEIQTSRTYTEIFQDNVFTFINGVFFSISLILFSLRRYGDIMVIIGIISTNAVVNLIQEMRAKRKLDQIALLTRPKVTAMRAGQRKEIDPAEIVVDDILVINPGDQMVVDGTIVGDGRMEVDESLLTGESDLITKKAGDMVYSGSFCVSGSAHYQAEKVGQNSLAFKLTTQARAFRHTQTPLQHEINLIIRVLLLVASFLWILTGTTYIIDRITLEESVQRVAVIAGLVPAGLYLMITLAYSLGAVRILGQSALIQQANAVESLSNVDVLCLDKTGTLTANRLQLEGVHPIGEINEADLRALLGEFVATMRGGNRTSTAIAEQCPGEPQSVHLEIPFSSARKWSALGFADEFKPGVYVMGAPEIVGQAVELTPQMNTLIEAGSNKGLRMLLFAHQAQMDGLMNEADHPQLPTALTPLALLSLSDELRPEAQQTLQTFTEIGVDIKIISGDHPDTVASLAKQAGLGDEIEVVSGSALAEMNTGQFEQTALNSTIFGRITPDQKAKLVQSLRNQGKYVAMIGDGVNDVLSLKEAHLGIAMESGSHVTRGVADIILLKDTFGALPYALAEGQRIRNGIQDVMKIFMVRVLNITLLIFAVGMVTGTFPLFIKHNSLVALLTVGLPTFTLTLWAKPGPPPKGSMIRSLAHFVLPATFSLTLIGLMVYVGYLVFTYLPLEEANPTLDVESLLSQALPIAQTALVSILIISGPWLIPFLKPPTLGWTGGAKLNGDWRHTIVALSMLGIYTVIIMYSPLRSFFELAILNPTDYLLMVVVTVVWGFALRYSWRIKLLDKFLGINLEGNVSLKQPTLVEK